MAGDGERLRLEHFPEQTIFSQAIQAVPIVATKGLLPALERDAIDRMLHETGGNVLLAAQRLGISRATLYRRLSKQKK